MQTISRLLATALGIALGAALWASAATAQPATDPRNPPLLPDLAEIVERGRLVVAQLDGNFPPMFMAAEDGTLTGFDVDMAREMATYLGVELEIRRTAATYDEVARMVARGEADIGISFLSRTPSRGAHLLFSRPYARQDLTMLINRRKGLEFRGTCPTVEEIITTAERANMLGVQTGSSNAERVRRVGPEAEPTLFESMDEQLAAVLAGDVPMSLQGELVARRFLRTNPAARIKLRLCEIAGSEDLIAIAVPPGKRDLRDWVNVFLDDYGVDFDAQELLDRNGAWVF